MNAKRTFAISLKVLRTLRHDKRSLGLMLVAPILAMSIFGFVFGSEVAHVDVAIVNEDAGPLAGRVLANVEPDALDSVEASSWEEARERVREGDARAAIRFPANFTAGALPQGSTPARGSEIEIFIDGSNSQIVAAVSRALLEAVQATAREAGARVPVSVGTEFAYAADAEFIDFFVPGIMAFAALLFTTLLTILAFVGERTSGTLSRLLVTPLTEAELVLGYALAFSVVGVLQGAVLLGVALVVFDALVVGELWLVFLVVALTAIDALALGILLSAAAKREAQAIQLFPLIVFPTFLLSGIFVPTETLPGWLRPLAYAIPPTYSANALRDVMLRGWGLDHVWDEVAALAGFAFLFLMIAVLGLKRGRAPLSRGKA